MQFMSSKPISLLDPIQRAQAESGGQEKDCDRHRARIPCLNYGKPGLATVAHEPENRAEVNSRNRKIE